MVEIGLEDENSFGVLSTSVQITFTFRAVWANILYGRLSLIKQIVFYIWPMCFLFNEAVPVDISVEIFHRQVKPQARTSYSSANVQLQRGDASREVDNFTNRSENGQNYA